MEFMNGFLDDEAANMRQFLNLISSPPPDDWIHGLNTGTEKVPFSTILLYYIISSPPPDDTWIHELNTGTEKV